MPKANPKPEHSIELEADFDKRTQQFVQLRDKMDEIKKRHAEELLPYNNAKAMLETYFLQKLDELGVSSVAGPHGTVYRSTQASATIADGEAFRAFVQERKAWELADIRANKTAVKEYVESQGVAPPGVNYSTHVTVGCRRGKE